ncbi:uncharacterized protein [Physcomitrium patens]|uniref:PX domain-containing protein n=1 Tax=Physcomitrium patens TaxID=3218 RepID=A0A2K1J4Z6_PHYPA|nr:uncharacterized protein LOC112294255 isoform X2 [Physcomitrium patens]PNR36580.1 hypothetical protein PHYPA_022431 [Physcomitrium patens]|eukprot:XP_024400310.1 uncharacterized protein LOC112294255 isoform X2 [Physcomitrella patens]
MKTWMSLLEEAKRRAIMVVAVAVTLAYMMSLTSSSVWINLPIAIIVLAALRRVSFDIEIRWRLPPTQTSAVPQLPMLHRRQLSSHDPLLSEASHTAANRWRHYFNSPAVEAAVDEFTRSLIDEWVTNLWYSSVTSDEEAPEELRILINGMIGVVAQRVKRVNLITLLSRDVVDVVGSQFELYRRMKAKIGPDIIGSLSTEERDEKLKYAMMSSRELHPALVSPEAEYKVLKKLTGGIVALVLKRQDAKCGLLRIMARELLACVVLRPVINLANPGFINEMIENLALSSKERARQAAEEAAEVAKQRIPERILQRKPSISGLEMICLEKSQSTVRGLEIVPYQKNNERLFTSVGDIGTPSPSQLSVDSKRSQEIEPDDVGDWGLIPRADWAQVLDAVTQHRAQALTAEHLDNLWTKGRNYKQRESERSVALGGTTQSKKANAEKSTPTKSSTKVSTLSATNKDSSASSDYGNVVPTPVVFLSKDLHTKKEPSCASEQYRELLFGDANDGDETMPGIGFSAAETPGGCSSTKLAPSWKSADFARCSSDGDFVTFRRNNEAITENDKQECNVYKNLSKSDYGPLNVQRPPRCLSRPKSRNVGGEPDGWQESEEGPSEGLLTFLERPLSWDPSITDCKQVSVVEESLRPSLKAQASLLFTESTSQMLLKCEVLGAHFEKNGSKAFVVYTIKVTHTDNRNWQVQRRYRNFEQLHRRLKDVPSYSLCLPPKRFLSFNLDTTFVRERCVLLEKYLKDLLTIPSVAELHEIWDFLSVNSQIYSPGISPSVMKTLADDVVDDVFRQIRGVSDDISGALKLATSGIRQRFPLGSGDLGRSVATNSTQISTTLPSQSSTSQLSGPLAMLAIPDGDLGEKSLSNSTLEGECKGNYGTHLEDSGQGVGSIQWHSDGETARDPIEVNILKTAAPVFSSQSEMRGYQLFGRPLERALSEGHSPADSFASDVIEDELVIPQEWSPPKVTVPILNLVDQIFQLQGRGWIRRQILWIAKQILQLGMGDAFDDWLIARIQWLRNEDVVASGVHWLKGVLWPDGIFITKHPKNSAVVEDSANEFLDEGHPPINSFELRREAARRASFLREIIVDKAPATLVSLIGKKQYVRCAKDIYYFSQASVCMKQLAYNLLETVLLATFPELHDLILDVRSSVK